jgi:hypothetical protein
VIPFPNAKGTDKGRCSAWTTRDDHGEHHMTHNTMVSDLVALMIRAYRGVKVVCLASPRQTPAGESMRALRDASQQQIRVIDCRRCVSLAFLAVITFRPISRRCIFRRTHHTIRSLDGRCILNSLPPTSHLRRLTSRRQSCQAS